MTDLIKETKTNTGMNFMQLCKNHQGHEDLSSSSSVPISEHRKPWSDVAALSEKTITAQSKKKRKLRLTPIALHRSRGQGQEEAGFYILVTLIQQELPLFPWFLLLWFDFSLFLQRFDSSLSGFRQEDRKAAA